MKAFLILATAASVVAAQPLLLHTFTKQQINKEFWSEGANFGDFNHDGVNDIAAGPYWYEGPSFAKKHEYYPADKTFTLKKDDGTEVKIPGFEGALGKKNDYSKNFLMFTYDFNGD